MTSGWPSRVRNSSPSARMKMSLKPPALVVVMALIGRFGQLSCARAGPAAASAKAVDNSNAEAFMKSFRCSRLSCCAGILCGIGPAVAC
jgi:hypothetical protein